MTDAELSDREEELSKKDRLINAWLAVGPDAKARAIADLTDSSIAYASRIQSQMEDEEITEEEVEAVRDESLLEAYATRFDELVQQDEAEPGPAATEESADASTEDQPTQSRPSAQAAQQQHEQRQAQAKQQRSPQQTPQGQQPAQQQPQSQPLHQSHQPGLQARHQQHSYPEFSTDGQQPVSVEELQEFDRMLAMYEEEAHFEMQNLPPAQTAEAVGKLFMAQKARSLLRTIAGTDQNQ